LGRYIQKVLQPVTIPFACDYKGTLYARPHIAQISMQCLEEAGVDVLPWPPSSPDLSPIERVGHKKDFKFSLHRHWHNLGMNFRSWDSAPQDDINYLIRSMLRRVAEWINTRGGATNY
jgi:hypothetical protein